MNERSYWLGFAVFPGIGPGRFAKLLAHFGTAKNAWEASLSELQGSKIGDKLAGEFVAFRKTFPIETYEEKLQEAKVSYVTRQEAAYPPLLSAIKNPPFVLFYKGSLSVLDSVSLRSNNTSPTIGVVGTRKITEYGKKVTELLTRELVEAGCVIVSGLALGVDAVAHQTTLAAGGKTIAVLGCGIDCCYPKENQRLYEEILKKGGLIISEYGLGIAPSKGSFPSRNRIIAGLTLGTLVTEGASDSGALITAKDALENDRCVFAVPGPVTSSLSKGPYQLIKQGAVVVSSGREILEELGFSTKDKRQKSVKKLQGESKEEQVIIDLLAEQELHIDELVKRTGIPASRIGGILSLMEMKGLIKSLDAGFFTLN